MAGLPVSLASALDAVPDRAEPDDRFVLRNVPYRTIYGTDSRIEFMLFLDGRTYLIEAKRMNSPGSVDEKLAFVWLTAELNRPDHAYLLILDGEGWRPDALTWIEGKAQGSDRFDVLRLEGFKIWLSLKLREAETR